MRTLFIIFFVVSSTYIFSQESKNNTEFDLERYFNTQITPTERKQIYSNIYEYSQAIKQNSNNAANFLNRGVMYANLGSYSDAILDYNRALKLDSTMSYAYYNRGIAKSRFRFTKNSCTDIKKAAILGLPQAKELYKKDCEFFIPELGKLP